MTENKKKGKWSETFVNWGLLEVDTPKIGSSTVNPFPNQQTSTPTVSNPVVNTPMFTGGAIIPFVNPEKEKKAFEYFLKLLDKANIPGPDFFEFYNALNDNIKSMGGAITDEKMLYNIVFNTLKASGLKVEILHSSAEQYVGLLTEHFNKFNDENKQKLNEVISNRNKIIESLNNDIAQKLEQIKKLQEDVALHYSEINTVKAEIVTETNVVEEARVSFESAYTKMSNELAQIGSKCKQYITVQ